ncbi:MAG: hypothetical protein ACRETH_03350 [Steroidobacteraceae bacterium]
MSKEQLKLARDTLRLAVREYGWMRRSLSGLNRTMYRSGPGKFEAEHWSIVHFYAAMMDGFGDPLYDGDRYVADCFEVDDVERGAFGFNADTVAVALWHSEQGFVTMQELNEARATAFAKAYNADIPAS